MQESKAFCRSAAKALIGIAPGIRAYVISLFEALNQDHSSDPEELLATFRFSLVQPTAAEQGASAEEVRQAIEDALRRVPSKKQSNLGAQDMLSTSA